MQQIFNQLPPGMEKNVQRVLDENSFLVMLLISFSFASLLSVCNSSLFQTSLNQVDEAYRFALHLAGITQNLIQSNRLIVAVILICILNLTERFPTVPLMKAYAEGAMELCERFCKTNIILDSKVSKILSPLNIFISGLGS